MAPVRRWGSAPAPHSPRPWRARPSCWWFRNRSRLCRHFPHDATDCRCARLISSVRFVRSRPPHLDAALCATRQPWSLDDWWAWREISSPRINPDGTDVVYVETWNDRATDRACANLWQVSTTAGTPRAHHRRPLARHLAALVARTTASPGSPTAPVRRRSGCSARGAETHRPRRPAASARLVARRKVARLHGARPPLRHPRRRRHAARIPARRSGNSRRAGVDARRPIDPRLRRAAARCRQRARRRRDLRRPRRRWLAPPASPTIPAPTRSPCPSPDGSRIAWIAREPKPQSYVVSKLYVANPDGSRAKVLAGSLDRDVRHPQWSSDSRTVYFLADDHGATRVYAARNDGSVRQVTTAPDRLTEFSVADTGRAVTVRAPAELLTFPVDLPAKPVTLAAPNRATARRSRSRRRRRDSVPIGRQDHPGLDRQTAGLRPREEVSAARRYR